MARRAKPKNIAEDQKPVLSAEERFEKHYPLIRDAKMALEAAQAEQKKIVGALDGAYRNLLKAFKKEGGNVDMLIRVLNDHKREIAEVDRDLRDYNAYAKMAGLPVGTQLGLFADGVTVATKVDQDRMAEQNGKADDFKEGRPLSSEASIAKAKTQGFDAGTDGKNASDNPYADGSPEFLGWEAERMRAQSKIAHGMGRNGARHPEHATA